MNQKSGQRIEKATELLWKIWWFCFYLIIVPAIISVIWFFIFNFIIRDIILSIGFSVLAFIFSVLFFFKSYDKYRREPFFKNQRNNPIARIHIVFLITILSLIVTPIFMIVTPEGYRFELLPLISFCVLYNIVYYYYYFQPIDFFDITESKFKHAVRLNLVLKQFYNFIVALNFVGHIIFLSYTFYTGLSWFFALLTNLIFYVYTLISTKKSRKRIDKAIQEGKPFLEELAKYKQIFATSLLSLIFILLIEIPYVIIIIYNIIGLSDSYSGLFNASLLSIVFILFYLKFRIYILINFKKYLMRLDKSGVGK
ncbi:MAG: hypothetical protein ACFE85_13005 [Candidatus Hodarchaeota archaeon]